MKIYLAGPFFNDKEREIKARVKAHLEEILRAHPQYKLYDPQTAACVDSWEQPNCNWGRKVFIKDKILLDDCDIVIAIDWGLYGDCGTAWEIGYAFGQNKRILVIAPNETLTTPHSVMIANGSDNFVTLSRFLKSNEFSTLINNADKPFFAAGVEQK